MNEYKEELKKLTKELYKYPPGSSEFYDIRFKIEECLENGPDAEKYSQYLIAVRSRIMEECKRSLVSYHKGVGGMNDKFSSAKYFSRDITFPEDKGFVCLKRSELEFNPFFKQLVVACFIRDETHAILLHSTANQRIAEKLTMIQGHVDFTPKAYLLSQIDFLQESIIREINEELKLKDDDRPIVPSLIDPNQIKPTYTIALSGNHIDIEHVGIVYDIKVANASRLFDRITTAEPENHQVELVELKTLIKGQDTFELDNWFTHILSKIEDEIEANEARFRNQHQKALGRKFIQD